MLSMDKKGMKSVAFTKLVQCQSPDFVNPPRPREFTFVLSWFHENGFASKVKFVSYEEFNLFWRVYFHMEPQCACHFMAD